LMPYSCTPHTLTVFASKNALYLTSTKRAVSGRRFSGLLG
jgi:hypothetical protein